MSLSFGSNTADRCDHGSDTSLDNLNPFTWAFWLYPTTLTNNRLIASKGTQKGFALSGTGGDVIMQIARTGTLQYITNTTPLATTNAWHFLVLTVDSGGGAGQLVNIYHGTLAAAAAEATYGTATDSSGAFSSDAAANWKAANNNSNNGAFQGRIGWVGVWNRALALGEILDQQFNPHVTSGCVLFSVYGWNGTNTQPNWASPGSLNNGTPAGAGMAVAAHVPLPAYGPYSSWVPYVVAAPAGGVTFRRSLTNRVGSRAVA